MINLVAIYVDAGFSRKRLPEVVENGGYTAGGLCMWVACDAAGWQRRD